MGGGDDGAFVAPANDECLVVGVELPVSGAHVIEGTGYDNLNGGTYGHDVQLFLTMEELSKVDIDDANQVTQTIRDDLNKLGAGISNEYFENVHLELFDENDEACQRARPLHSQPDRDPDALTIWTPGTLRRAVLSRKLRSGYALPAFPAPAASSRIPTPSDHLTPTVAVAVFCSALWSGFSPPLTVRLWVIETKYRRVPREHFPEVLRRIADNTTAVWEWAAPGTPVRECLVLAYESRIHRKTYDYGKEAIVVHPPVA